MKPDYIEKMLAEAKFIHLTDEELTAHHHQELDAFTDARAEAHLRRCRDCKARAAELYEAQVIFGEMARAGAGAPAERNLSVALLPPEKIDINTPEGVLTFALVCWLARRISANKLSGGVKITVRPLRAVLNARAPLSDPVAVGRELRANRVVRIEDVRCVGQSLSFTPRLIDISDIEGTPGLGGGSADAASTAAERAAEEFLRRVGPTRAEQKRLVELQAANPDSAEVQCTMGRFYLNNFPGGALEKAAECFKRAVELDESSAEAHAGLAYYYMMEGIYNVSGPEASFRASFEHAERALELNPNLAEAHAALAYAYMCYERDWPRAREEFEKALALEPDYAPALQGLAHLLGALGDFAEAVRESDRALEVDPTSSMLRVVRALIFYYAACGEKARRPLLRKARKQCLVVLDEINKRFDPAWYVRALVCVQLALVCREKGRAGAAEKYFKEAEYAAKRARSYTRRNAQKQATLAFIYFLWGKEQEALDALKGLNEALTGDSYISPYHLALVHVARNRTDDAIDCLRRAFEVRDQWMILVRYEPAFKVLRGDERFEELIRRLDFPPSPRG